MSHDNFVSMLGMIFFVYAMYVGLEWVDSSLRIARKRYKQHRKDV